MTLKQTLWILLAALVGVFIFSAMQVRATPSYFLYNSTNSVTSMQQTATTTVTYQTAGTATATVALNGGLGSSQALDSASLVLYRNASGLTTDTQIAFEFSPNCNATFPEWFPNKLDVGATTTPDSVGFIGANKMRWQFSSTTVGGVQENGVNASTEKLTVTVPTPTNCVRAILTTPIGAASSSIWGMMIGKRQAP